MANDIISTPFLDILLFMYPAYCSATALKTNDREKIVQFMTFWIIFAAFSTVENFLTFFLRFVPLYSLAKRVFFIWCVLPTPYNGASLIYKNVLEDLVQDINQEVIHLSQISLQQVRRTAEELKQKYHSRSVRNFLGEASDPPQPPGPLVDGLEQLQDKTEAYRDSVMNQLLGSLGSADAAATAATQEPKGQGQGATGQSQVVAQAAAPRALPFLAAAHRRFCDLYTTEDDDSADSATGDDITWS